MPPRRAARSAQEGSVKILVIDDHPLVVDALKALLPQWGDGVEVLAAGDAAAAIRLLDEEPAIALTLLDLALPGTRGLDFLADLMLDYPGVPVLVLSATHDRATVAAVLAAGARGFVSKTARPEALFEAIAAVADGDLYIPDELADVPDADGVRISPDQLGLTRRQSDVLRLLVQGKPNKLICRDLQLSEGTVKVHVSAILKALRVHTRAQAVAELARRGISVETLAARRGANP
jgi:DNA-binding NarL/FixJ family response regulator